MKLSKLQILWLVLSVAMIGTVLIDVFGIRQVEPVTWMLGFGLLTPIGWFLMPSLREIKRAQRRGRISR